MYVSTPVQQYLMKLPIKTSDHFHNLWMYKRNYFYTDIVIINQCFCRCEYVLEIDHMNEKVSTALSNHVSSLLAQQNHVVHLCIDMKIASRVIIPVAHAVVVHYVVMWP